LSGKQPFSAKKMEELNDNIINGEFQSIKNVSDDVNDLLRKILEVNPKKRISINQILEHSWMSKDDNRINGNGKQLNSSRFYINNSSFIIHSA
jgi:serine/threonine protein kinase